VTRPDVVARLRAAGCVFAEDEAAVLLEHVALEHLDDAALDALVVRRAAGEPLEHVVGWALFCGLRVVVAPGVFVPRVRSELLAVRAAGLARDAVARGGGVVVDLCCGSGALGLVVATRVPGVDLHAADVDPAAVACARANLAAVTSSVHAGDLDAALPPRLRGRVDVLVANVPYVPTDAVPTMPAEARVHEGRVALDGGPDGLEIQRRVAALAGDWLAPGGAVLVETSDEQARPAADAFEAHGLTAEVVTDDDLEATVVIGRTG
jgi:release factor glutamine methyltransferase